MKKNHETSNKVTLDCLLKIFLRICKNVSTFEADWFSWSPCHIKPFDINKNYDKYDLKDFQKGLNSHKNFMFQNNLIH